MMEDELIEQGRALHWEEIVFGLEGFTVWLCKRCCQH